MKQPMMPEAQLAFIGALLAGFLWLPAVSAAPVPENVPELMVTFGGEKVSTVEQWEKVRAPELLKTFTLEE